MASRQLLGIGTVQSHWGSGSIEHVIAKYPCSLMTWLGRDRCEKGSNGQALIGARWKFKLIMNVNGKGDTDPQDGSRGEQGFGPL